jgi:abortive infection bacteriophage resistance protein
VLVAVDLSPDMRSFVEIRPWLLLKVNAILRRIIPDMNTSQNSATRKPWLTPTEQVAHMASKGVKFDLMSKGDAASYLAKNNIYFRLSSYRVEFSKVEEGSRSGQYANLDFKMLVDMSIIDMMLRNEMIVMTLDVEHFAKVHLLTRIEQEGEDGYAIVSDYLRSCDVRHNGRVENRVKIEINRGKSSPYISGLLNKYPNFDFPVWAFMEVISFGTFCYFLRFCGERFQDRDMQNMFYLLMAVKSLRNACAHNNCILNFLGTDGGEVKLGYAVARALGAVPGIGKGQRKSKMKNCRLQQIVTTLYLHKQFASEGVVNHRVESLQAFKSRMLLHVDFYNGTAPRIRSTFYFLAAVIDAWYPLEL